MNTFLALTTAFICLLGSIWYIYLICKEKVVPSTASWLVFSVTITLSFLTYYTSKDFSWIAGAMNFTSSINATSIFIAVLYKKIPLEMNSVQKKSLLASAVIIIIWITLVWGFGKTGFVPNILTQILMIIAYFLTIRKVWSAKVMKESKFLWWSITLAGVTSLLIAINKTDSLSMLYATRSIICSGFLLYVMSRIKRRNLNSNT